MNGGNSQFFQGGVLLLFFFKFRLEENIGALRVGGWTPVK